MAEFVEVIKKENEMCHFHKFGGTSWTTEKTYSWKYAKLAEGEKE